jgi:hypothetical protein
MLDHAFTGSGGCKDRSSPCALVLEEFEKVKSFLTSEFHL